MGLFDAVQSKPMTEAEGLSIPEAIAAIGYIMSAADGYLTDDEVNLLIPALQSMQCFQSYSDDVLVRLFDKIKKLFNRLETEDYLAVAASAIPGYMRPSVFALAADIAFVDGEVEGSEQAVLEMLYQIFELPEDLALSIINVMQIRHKY